jgi:hypothetical protein
MPTSVSAAPFCQRQRPAGRCATSHSPARASSTRSRRTRAILSQLGQQSREKWFDFCYRFAVCVKPCYRSRPVLSPHPHGAVTDILATVRLPTFPNACSTCSAYRLCFPLWSSTFSRFHAGATLAGRPRVISVPSFLLCGHLLVRCFLAVAVTIASAYHGCASTLLAFILIASVAP